MKRALTWVGTLLLLLVGIVLARTALFRSQQVQVQPAALVKVDSDAAVARFAGSLRFRTVSNQDPAQFDVAQFRGLHAYLAAQFPLVDARLQRETVSDYSLLYTWPGRDSQRRPVVLMAHLDVVPIEPGTEEKWAHPPFDGLIADGLVWGRGALDDKLGVLSILEAVETMLRDGFQPAATIYLAFGHDEEVGGPHGAVAIAALLQSRGVQAEMVLDEGGSLIRGILPGLSVTVACIGIAEKGRLSVELTAHVEGGHSSSPPEHTAVGLVSTAVHRLERQQMPAELKGPLRRFLDRIGPETSFPYRLALANLWLTRPLIERVLVHLPAANASLRTTTAATMISGGVKENVLPSSARAVVNFRILPGDSVATVLEHVRRVVDDPRIGVAALDGAQEPSPESPVDTPSFALLERTIRAVYPDAAVAPYLTIGGTDSRHYDKISANIYRFTPFVGDKDDLARIHGTNERAAVEYYIHAVQFFVELLRGI
jgi:carboxypeptidase PM20D1